MKQWPTLEDVDVAHKTVLVREDFNVPMNSGVITNDTRIQKALPTIQTLLEKQAGILLLSHLGRPKPGVPDQAFSLKPVAKRLSELLNHPVRFEAEWINGVVVQPGEVVLAENVRFFEGETSNDPVLAKKMAALADVFVIDAFGTAHRAHASTVGIGHCIPAVAGPLLDSELKALTEACLQPQRPVVAIVGGAKVSSKLKLLQSLIKKMDAIILGGGIANTFLAAKGIPVGASLYEPDLVSMAQSILKEAKKHQCQLMLPQDVIVTDEISETATATERTLDALSEQDKIVDVGRQTRQAYQTLIQSAATVLWNGPVGVFEMKQFSYGTESLAQAIAGNTGFSIAGGGDTLAAIDMFHVKDRISYVSTGGGAFLAFLEGETLPVVEMLEQTIK